MYFNSDAQFYEDLIQPVYFHDFFLLPASLYASWGRAYAHESCKTATGESIQPQDDLIHDPSTMNTTDELYKLIRQTVEEAESKENKHSPYMGQGKRCKQHNGKANYQ